jgi:hypothetical protein
MESDEFEMGRLMCSDIFIVVRFMTVYVINYVASVLWLCYLFLIPVDVVLKPVHTYSNKRWGGGAVC